MNPFALKSFMKKAKALLSYRYRLELKAFPHQGDEDLHHRFVIKVVNLYLLFQQMLLVKMQQQMQCTKRR
jgi:hypothetical protein